MADDVRRKGARQGSWQGSVAVWAEVRIVAAAVARDRVEDGLDFGGVGRGWSDVVVDEKVEGVATFVDVGLFNAHYEDMGGKSRFVELLILVILARYRDLVCCAGSKTRADRSQVQVCWY